MKQNIPDSIDWRDNVGVNTVKNIKMKFIFFIILEFFVFFINMDHFT